MDQFGTYIPIAKRDHRYGVFHVKYCCKIPYIHTRSIDDLRRFGMPSSGHREFDVGQENQLVDRYYSINEILQFWLDGVNIRVNKYEDTALIYLAISEYLQYWLDHIRQTFSTNHVPIDDLQKLDEFANVVYDKAKYNFSTEIISSAMLQTIDKVSVVNFDTILSPAKNEVLHINGGVVQDVAEDEPISEYPERENLMDLWKQARSKRTRRNNGN